MTIASQPANNEKEISPFHIFDRRDFAAYTCNNPENRFYNSYYMISLLTGSNCLEYAHQTIFTNHVLVFATPLTPCKCTPLHIGQHGYLCLLTEDFMLQSKIGLAMDHLPIFRPGGFPVFELSEQEAAEITGLFKKMRLEMNAKLTGIFQKSLTALVLNKPQISLLSLKNRLNYHPLLCGIS